MPIAEVIKLVKAFKGPIYVALLAKSDIIYVRAYKADLLVSIDGTSDDELVAFEKAGALYVDAA